MTTPEKRKLVMLLVLPVFVLLFSALGFYALGGGQGTDTVNAAERKPGINTALPGAQLQKDGPADKMGLYEKAQRDSATEKSHSAAGAFAALGWDTAKFNRPANTAADNEKRIQERLAAINRQINQPPPQPSRTIAALPAADNEQAEQLKQLEKMLRQKQVESSAPDPQMAQLSAMLDKIKEIQNPALVPDKVRAAEVGAVPVPDSAFKAIPALIDGNQKVPPGGVVKLVLADTVRVAGMLLEKGQSLWGACSVTNQRLLLDIKNIRLGSSIIPVNLTVFSLDGMAGIAVPEAELGAAAGQGADGALQGMQFPSGDYSLGSQAAVAGISAAKGLLGKKAKRIRVKLHGGQQVLLRLNGH
ncbi:conjugative transposon protein TraM [Mucilaginibacter rubeus]|uniref:Conjugative transposon protein TraM n=1 Tax=Mucilaginibacter rubeus TaxID=2027860 RepID=A0A5C1HTQ3_9SPHI|nr:conjugative transposon protein TraM [Mucilaginibacter rubeus]QEM09184.1 conjugative transposon protein TraM [Mucilaginibacter rubeus]